LHNEKEKLKMLAQANDEIEEEEAISS